MAWKAKLAEQERITYFMTEERAKQAVKDYLAMVAEEAEELKKTMPPPNGST